MSLSTTAASAIEPLRPAAGPVPVLTLSGIQKSFAGVRALVDGALELYGGEATALIGENGAGKSTLVKVLTGIHAPDHGTITLNGKPVTIGSADEAQRLGITAIHQEAVVFDDLSVAENIFVSHRPRGRFGMVDWSAMNARAAKLLAELEADFDPGQPLRSLSIAQKHLVQIARALSFDARVVIMDEPTAALSHREAEDLFRIVDRLKAEGRAILFISHKFEEIMRVADRYAVFRDGAAVGAGRIGESSTDDLIRMMVGRPVDQIFPKIETVPGDEALRVEGLSHPTEFDDVSFHVRRGEILGLYGLVGAGRSEVMKAVFGLTEPSAGRILVDGRPLSIRRPDDAIRAGIVYVPEDRQHQGAVLKQSIVENIALPSLAQLSRRGFNNRPRERDVAGALAQRLQVRMSGLDQPVEDLSGGNQQKVVIAKWLATQPRVLILDEPTKGIDVGSKAAVHRFMAELVAQGLAVVMVSSELPEVLGMADRVMVMARGRVRRTFTRAEATPEAVVRAATDA
ncbi:rhamnose ABC transporter ATP-binding protein [Pseudoxanthobacter soli DSM 19599]|uniref:Rhamnose ABC transporter ATP-binding protein n=1 Tax=Pseudoxanthobacter soli DSM 19599 TaxID=1123029 RepID=A0A1M7ZMM3_9HYPH|nr:sugar ABC transporter ATP-binding protein [Pseudoxanthobacter soli]SHO66059.1 rhamnose ABC transporter ATP-binding protein [Pseudoxanthobacter soli DSM 19599]